METNTAKANFAKYRILQRISHISLLLCMLVAVVLIGLMWIPRLFGYRVFAIISGSMEPTLPIGSLVFVCPAALTEIQEGDICTFQSLKTPGKRFTHTVMRVDTAQGLLYTQGDAANQPDPEPTPYENLLGRVHGTVPLAGWPMLLLEKRAVQVTVAVLLLIWLAVEMELAGERCRKRKKQLPTLQTDVAQAELIHTETPE